MNIFAAAKRLVIAEFDPLMAESVHINSLDADNRRFLPDEVFETVDDARETLEYLIGCYGSGSGPLVYAVLLNDGTQIGHVQLIPCEEGYEIGYHIGERYTGCGYASEAVSAFLPCIMSHVGIDHVIGVCRADNTASVRVLEKCGFELVFDGIGIYQGDRQIIKKYIFNV